MTKQKVTKLHRMYPNKDSKYHFYYSPEGHLMGPFHAEQDMEAAIAERYEEVE